VCPHCACMQNTNVITSPIVNKPSELSLWHRVFLTLTLTTPFACFILPIPTYPRRVLLTRRVWTSRIYKEA
jgi:hypothetical protein